MKEIYVVFKIGRQFDGEYIIASIEKAFTDKQKAEEFWKMQNKISWQEEVQGVQYQIERGIHSCVLEE